MRYVLHFNETSDRLTFIGTVACVTANSSEHHTSHEIGVSEAPVVQYQLESPPMVLTLTTSHVECPRNAARQRCNDGDARASDWASYSCSIAPAARHGAGGIVLTHERSRMDGSLEALGAEAGVPMAVRPMLAGIRQVGR